MRTFGILFAKRNTDSPLFSAMPVFFFVICIFSLAVDYVFSTALHGFISLYGRDHFILLILILIHDPLQALVHVWVRDRECSRAVPRALFRRLCEGLFSAGCCISFGTNCFVSSNFTHFLTFLHTLTHSCTFYLPSLLLFWSSTRPDEKNCFLWPKENPGIKKCFFKYQCIKKNFPMGATFFSSFFRLFAPFSRKNCHQKFQN